MGTISNTAADLPDSRMAAPVIPDVTVPEFVLGEAQLRGGKRALVDATSGRELTYAELATAVREGGEWLAARGVQAGDVLALCAPKPPRPGPALLTLPRWRRRAARPGCPSLSC